MINIKKAVNTIYRLLSRYIKLKLDDLSLP